MPPDSKIGNFVKRYDGDYIYGCYRPWYGWGLLYVGKTARCITSSECFFWAPKGILIQVNNVCMQRQDWLDRDPRNYVNGYWFGVTHTEEVTADLNALELCIHIGYTIQGIALMGGMVCWCSPD